MRDRGNAIRSRWSWCAYMGCLLLLSACGGGSGGGGTVVVVPAGPPAAQIWLPSLTDMTAVAMEFQGQGADPDGDGLSYAWDFDGDGTTDDMTRSPTNTFAVEGERSVTLTVTDSDGSTALATAVVSIRDSTPGTADPAVAVQAFSLLGDPDLEVHFNATAFDPDGGGITTYEWDTDNNGTFDGTTSAPVFTETYTSAGQKVCRVRVTDNDGATSEATVTIVLCADGGMPEVGPGVQAPIAGSDASGATPAPFGSSGATVSLDAFGSDIDGGAPLVRWDTDGDGMLDDASGRTATFTLGSAPSQEVRCRMFDDDLKAGDSLVTIRVDDANGATNEPAGVMIQSQAVLVSTNAEVCFYGHVSDDAPGFSLAWDMDGDGATDSTAMDPSFTFTEPGRYAPELIVTDAGGLTSRAYIVVIVESCPDSAGPPPPGPYFWCDCEDLYILHGGTGRIAITCPVSILGSLPSEASVTGKWGTPGVGGDPFGMGIEVRDTAGNLSPPPAMPPPNPGPPPFFITVKSLDVDPPPRVVCYTITIKLRDPGVRVQILKCIICVVHDYLACGMVVGGSAPAYSGQVLIQPPAPATGLPPIAPIHRVEMHYNEQDPNWVQVSNVQNLPMGWNFQIDPVNGLVRFDLVDTLVGQPIQPGQNWGCNINFQTMAVVGVTPNGGVWRFFDESGEDVGAENWVVLPP